MKYLDLFSGIGGFALGAYWAGMKFDAHYFSDVDPWAVELYQKRFPDAIPLGDIRGIDGKALADTASERPQGHGCKYGLQEGGRKMQTGGGCSSDWLITGGFPCQDISYAGAGAGLAGERSGLFYEAARIIGELGPRLVILENVRALLTRGIGDVLGTLSDLGYDCEWEIIRASDVGAPHRRERVWIVAYPKSDRDPQQQSAHRGTHPTGEEGAVIPDKLVRDVPDTGSKRRAAGLPTATAGQEGLTGKPVNGGHQQRGWPGPGEGPTQPGLGGCPDGLFPWMDGWEQGLPRLATGVPQRVNRLRGDGNAIVPEIAELIFRQWRVMQ